ncbi:MAG: hypothetical protein OXH02_07020 [Gemmatimonadetes bacterium]|nr:hypothetical protein [Gemmatimonadota bacterium]
MGVGAAESEGIHTGIGGTGDADRLGGHLQPEIFEGDIRIRMVEVQGGWQDAVLERQRRLYETRDPGRGLGVADIGLHRTNQAARAVRDPSFLRGTSDGHRFNGVARGRSRAMGFHEGKLSGAYATSAGGRLNDGLLGALPRDRQAAAAPVLVDRGPVNNRVDRIAVGQRFGQAFQHDDARAVASSVTVCPLVKGPAAPIRRQHLRLRESAGRLRRQQQIGATGEGGRARPGLEVPAGQVYSRQ